MQRFIHWIGYRFSSSVVLSKELTLVVKVSPDGKSLNLASTCGGFNANYHSIWLRHNCHCNTCLSSSGQKMMSGKLINKDTVISKALIKGKSESKVHLRYKIFGKLNCLLTFLFTSIYVPP